MGSEDFSEILNEVPGTFFFLAASPPDVDHNTCAWNHSPEVLFEDAVLGDQAAALAALALKKLSRGVAEDHGGNIANPEIVAPPVR